MSDKDKTKAQLIDELTAMRRRISALEALETKRKQAEQSLRESETRFAGILDVAADAIISTDETQQIILFNKGAENIFGYSAQEMIGKSLNLLIPERFWTIHQNYIAQFVRSATPIYQIGEHQQIFGRRKNGEEFPAESSISQLEVGGRKIFTIVLHDIAKRKRLEEQLAAIYQLGQELTLLHNEAAIIRRVLETATTLLQFEIVGCGLVDRQAGVLRYCYSIPEIMELSMPLTGPETRGISVAVVHSGQALNVPDVMQDPRYVFPPGGLPICSELCVPIKVDQQVIGVLNIESSLPNCFTSDDQQLLQTLADQVAVALENARLHTEMRRRAQELAALHFAGRTVVSSLDLDTILQQAMIEAKILLEAEGASILLHHSPSDELIFATAASPGTEALIGAPVPLKGSIAGWVMRHKEPVLVDNAQKDSRFYNQIDNLTGLNTRSLLAVPLMVNEEVIGVIETINKAGGTFNLHDLELLEALTSSVAVAIANARLYENLQEQMQMLQETQAQLVQSEKMAAVGRLSASIAHEINNPLQAIQNSLTLLKEEMDSHRRPQELRCYLDIAEEEIKRISKIMHRLRAFYRPARQKEHPLAIGSLDTFYRPTRKELQLIDLTVILKSVLYLVDAQLKENGITAECNLNSNLPPIQGNSHHLKQVFLNLVLNAVEAMAAQGGVLHLNSMPDQAQLDNGQLLPVVRLEFSDTGVGIPPEAIPHLFEPFFSTKAQGSGLGLSISYKIIRAYNGRINVESQMGMGTTFTILLPLKQP